MIQSTHALTNKTWNVVFLSITKELCLLYKVKKKQSYYPEGQHLQQFPMKQLKKTKTMKISPQKGRESNPFKRRVMEAISIKTNNPELNLNVGKFNIPLKTSFSMEGGKTNLS